MTEEEKKLRREKLVLLLQAKRQEPGKCKDEAQKIGGIKEIMPPHYGTAEKETYRELFQQSEFICRRCGYNEFVGCVDIHHIDENHKNNEKANLMPLCATCHKALHWKLWKLEELGT